MRLLKENQLIMPSR